MSTHSEHTHDPRKEARAHVITLVTLLILTIITVGASYIQFGSPAANVVIALTIATFKATIVGLFFMHLLHDKAVNAIIAVAGYLFLGIFLLFCFIDIGSRGNLQPTNLHPPTAVAASGEAGAAAPAGEKAAEGKKE